MCGRYSLSTPGDELARVFEIPGAVVVLPRYNIAPTQGVPVVRTPGGAPRELAILRWGLVPSWAKEPTSGARLINARAETVAEKPAFKDAFRTRRCLVVADGFFEWQKRDGGKQPFHIRRRDGGPFAFAGLWERWAGPQAPAVETCTVITTAANALLLPIYDRMPVILRPEAYATWLDPKPVDRDRLLALLRPANAEELVAVPVSTAVNNPANDDRSCVAPLYPT
ncbi:MAG: SOS response-associated peptidase [Deltaproteobacteria bacterium]|nr:SOS response-associated peptidase [Deltaproteobacteria bacterium]